MYIQCITPGQSPSVGQLEGVVQVALLELAPAVLLGQLQQVEDEHAQETEQRREAQGEGRGEVDDDADEGERQGQHQTHAHSPDRHAEGPGQVWPRDAQVHEGCELDDLGVAVEQVEHGHHLSEAHPAQTQHAPRRQ